jgi:hypothetical protein
MKRKQKKWCGEGDLFSCGVLKTRKLYTLRRRQSSESARRTNLSHTASHTGSKITLWQCRAGVGGLHIGVPE